MPVNGRSTDWENLTPEQKAGEFDAQYANNAHRSGEKQKDREIGRLVEPEPKGKHRK